jgi:hypothetical protein
MTGRVYKGRSAYTLENKTIFFLLVLSSPLMKPFMNYFQTSPTQSRPQIRRRSSMEDVIDFSRLPEFEPTERARVQRRFTCIVTHFELDADRRSQGHLSYNAPRLVRLTYEYARSEESKDTFLRFFFNHMAIPPNREDDDDLDFNNPRIKRNLSKLGDTLVRHFFLPRPCPLPDSSSLVFLTSPLAVKASTGRVRRPTAETRSALQMAQAGEEFLGTLSRSSLLRLRCLERDRQRCVISHLSEPQEVAGDHEPSLPTLQVAHILPHSLTQTRSGSYQLVGFTSFGNILIYFIFTE